MCNKQQYNGAVSKKIKMGNKEKYIAYTVMFEIIFVLFIFACYLYFSPICAIIKSNYPAVLYCIVFFTASVIGAEILWIMYLHTNYSEYKKNKREYVQRIIDDIAVGKKNSTMMLYAVFVAEKAEHEHSNLPLIIAAGSLCVSSLKAMDGDWRMFIIALILLLAVCVYTEEKRLYAIEDAVKDYVFSNSKDNQDSPTANK
ncbi:MAG: hypothetical protein J6N55_04745 [Anaerovibrio sp.]|uniref:hypothetical protein n=1 Tax=Anaerovibrio sp. TaxID=1872532 RepID=UPI001B2E22AA|nr:hypothetical protein [Anaerovibrio sp.]MBO6245574.1 hypothetical protein [Anaerovibrio sp.]